MSGRTSYLVTLGKNSYEFPSFNDIFHVLNEKFGKPAISINKAQINVPRNTAKKASYWFQGGITESTIRISTHNIPIIITRTKNEPNFLFKDSVKEKFMAHLNELVPVALKMEMLATVPTPAKTAVVTTETVASSTKIQCDIFKSFFVSDEAFTMFKSLVSNKEILFV